MRAVVLRAFNAPLELEERDIPAARNADESVLRVLACGVCHSDLHVVENASAPSFRSCSAMRSWPRTSAWGTCSSTRRGGAASAASARHRGDDLSGRT